MNKITIFGIITMLYSFSFATNNLITMSISSFGYIIVIIGLVKPNDMNKYLSEKR